MSGYNVRRTIVRTVVVAIAVLIVWFAINALFTYVQIHQGCTPGPKPYGWTAAQYQSYASTVCSGVG